MRRRAAALAAACLALLSAAASGADPAAVGILPPALTRTWADLSADVNDNRVYGNGLVLMPHLQAYLNGLLGALKTAAGVPDWPGQVYITADTTLNAHSSAAGNIYLNMGVIRSAQTEDEVVAVLAHEFAHVYLNHQAAYDAHGVAEAARTLGQLTMLATGRLPSGGATWTGFDSVGAANSLTHASILPRWQRSVEEEADRVGATLLLKLNYSYAAGFKTFLERLATIEQREAASAPSVDGSAATHADAATREASLTAQVLPLLPRPRPQPRSAPWHAALADPQTAEVLAHYALTLRIDEALRRGQPRLALELAQQASSGATLGDGSMVLQLQEVMRRTGFSADDRIGALLRNRDWPEKAWAALYLAATLIPPEKQQQLAKAYLEEQYRALGEPPRAWPDLLAFYLSSRSDWDRMALGTRCLLNGKFSAACREAQLTPQQKAQIEAQNKARSEQMGTNLGNKIIDRLHLKR